MPEYLHGESAHGKSSRFRSRRHALSITNSPAPRQIRYIVDGTIHAAPNETTLTDALSYADAEEGRMALCLFPSPTDHDIDELAAAWDLHPILLEDIRGGGQRPKIERYGEVLFVVMRSARYIDEIEDVDFSEFHVLVRPNAVAVICQDSRWIDGDDNTALAPRSLTSVVQGDEALLDDAELLKLGPEAMLYRLLDAVVDGYVPVLRGVGIDKEQIERQVFSGDAAVAERIYRLSQEVIDLQHAASSLAEVLAGLSRGFNRYRIPEPLKAYLQDVTDNLTRVETHVLELREALAQILNVNATLVAQRQNEDMKKISGWAAILFAPTLIGAIYGMNFDRMPELHWEYGYPAAIGAMVALGVALYVIFKRKHWM